MNVSFRNYLRQWTNLSNHRYRFYCICNIYVSNARCFDDLSDFHAQHHGKSLSSNTNGIVAGRVSAGRLQRAFRWTNQHYNGYNVCIKYTHARSRSIRAIHSSSHRIHAQRHEPFTSRLGKSLLNFKRRKRMRGIMQLSADKIQKDARKLLVHGDLTA